MRYLLLASLARTAGALLAFESIRLESRDVAAFPAINFTGEEAHIPSAKCKSWPGDESWPSATEWGLFNRSIDGALLKPVPAAAACYHGPNYDAAKCSHLVNNATDDNTFIDDPLTVLTQWTQGDSCWPSLNATGDCEHGGYPLYVVNATTVKHVQAAVNFARNRNIRLVIKSVPICPLYDYHLM